MKILLIISLLTAYSIHGYVISEDENEEVMGTTPAPSGDKDPEDLNTLLVDISKAVFGDDTELIKEIAEEIDEEMSDSSKEALENMKKNFAASLLRLQGGELYKDARREVMLSALRTAFQESPDDVEPTFIADIGRKLREREHLRRHKTKEFETNGVKAQTNDQSLKDKKK